MSRTCRDRFFLSSRRRHTILVSDWSSDVCSSDRGGTYGERRLQLTSGVHFDQRRELVTRRGRRQGAETVGREDADDQQDGACARSPGLENLGFVDDEVLAKDRERYRRGDLRQVVERAAKVRFVC